MFQFPRILFRMGRKRDYSPFEHMLKVHELVFEEQIRIYSAKRLWVSHKKTLQTLNRIFLTNSKH